VVVGVGLGERIDVWTAIGIGLALVAVVLVAADDGLSSLGQANRSALAASLAAGAGFGLFFVLLDRTHSAAGLTPLVGARLMSVSLVLLLAAATGRSLRIPLPALPIVLLAGVGDMVANALFLLATQQGGQLAITGVLASLYPASTVLLAQLVLRERLVATQAAGLGAAAVLVLPGLAAAAGAGLLVLGWRRQHRQKRHLSTATVDPRRLVRC
jgi:drug/metabolite transporter (DMT)-like permease